MSTVRSGQKDLLFTPDTIVALATIPGRSAIGIVRLSGVSAGEYAAQLIAPWPLTPRRATRCTIRSKTGDMLDDAIVTWFPQPRSYTGEEVVEIACHGGWMVPASVMTALIDCGARVAMPGEFTRRAVLNGKMDLLQAEAVGDLISARARGSQRVALRQLDGGLSRRILELRESVLMLEALIAYEIDFPEEDDGPITSDRVEAAADQVATSLDELLATTRVGELVREGAVVVIAGAPNVGKSSLFNALLGRQRALVTAIPGTTRDALEAVIETEIYPLRLVDTAGLRETVDAIERLGIEVSESYLATADVVLACGDDAESIRFAVDVIQRHTSARILCVRTKADVATERQVHQSDRDNCVTVSAETGVGLDRLIQAILTKMPDQDRMNFDAPMLTHARHQWAIRTARDEIRAFQNARTSNVPATVAAVHLRAAVHTLEELVGAVDVEDVLGRVFSTFCVGK